MTTIIGITATAFGTVLLVAALLLRQSTVTNPQRSPSHMNRYRNSGLLQYASYTLIGLGVITLIM